MPTQDAPGAKAYWKMRKTLALLSPANTTEDHIQLHGLMQFVPTLSPTENETVLTQNTFLYTTNGNIHDAASQTEKQDTHVLPRTLACAPDNHLQFSTVITQRG